MRFHASSLNILILKVWRSDRESAFLAHLKLSAVMFSHVHSSSKLCYSFKGILVKVIVVIFNITLSGKEKLRYLVMELVYF